MLIIKPYGKSIVKENQDARQIIKTNETEAINITEFVKIYPEVVLAQWISVIDKIIAKPAKSQNSELNTEENTLPNATHLRKILGDAAWPKTGLSEDKRLLWDWKIAATQPKAPRDIKGRWYKRFVGDIECNEEIIEKYKEDITEKIHRHLNIAAYRFPPKTNSNQPEYSEPRCHKQGLIAHRSGSIEKNILKRDKLVFSEYTDTEKIKYRQKVGSIASDIKTAILKEWPAGKTGHNQQNSNGYREPPYNIAVEVLKTKWLLAFDPWTSFDAVKENYPEQLDLHLQIKETYKRLLKGRKGLNKKLEKILPANDHVLFNLIAKQQQNQSINHLIRLGKIIHYEASDKENRAQSNKANHTEQKTTTDNVAAIVSQWPNEEEVNKSRFWSSTGQTEIKQNEAFVRIWRSALAFATRTLKDWADPQNQIEGDILLGESRKQAIDNFGGSDPDEKYKLLFGSNLSKDDTKELLDFSLKSIYDLRNAAFHFKGMKLFTKTLRNSTEDKIIAQHLENFYKVDWEKYYNRCREIMAGAHFHKFLSEKDIREIWKELTSTPQSSLLPLPRLKRVLERVENTWKGKDKQLPPYSTADEREHSPWAQCQYTATKFLYDKPFKHWLEQQDQNLINTYIETALERTTQAAKNLNGQDENGKYIELIQAKAETIDKLREGEKFEDFFFKLTAATAQEQPKSYQPDSDGTKQQADHIEKFKCDVVALAFADYLKATLENITLFCQKDRTEKQEKKFNYQSLIIPSNDDKSSKVWPAKLYFLLHLMPVEEVGSLRQQLKKWKTVTNKSHGEAGREEEIITAVLDVFDLYIAMHDAQFVQADLLSLSIEERHSEENTLTNIIKSFFEDENDFEQIFPKRQVASNAEKSVKIEIEHLPIRDLREMQRFGTSTLLELYEKYKIPSANVRRWQELEKTIADEQKKLKTLHEKWVEKKRIETKDYQTTLRGVEEYRHLTAQVKLQNHLRLHRLLMKILGRLLDFSGLWERDLYFVLLALLYQNGTTNIKQKFYGKNETNEKVKAGWEYLKEGRIVDSFIELNDADLKAKITYLFGINGIYIAKKDESGNEISLTEQIKSLKKKDYIAWLRNRFAHFAMLEIQNSPVKLTCEVKPFNLTYEINKARHLMSYDRKLKNAVSKAILDLLKRENIKLMWDMGADHQLAKVSSLCSGKAYHLRKKNITENLHGKDFINMVYALFGGTGEAPCKERSPMKTGRKKIHHNGQNNRNNQYSSRTGKGKNLDIKRY